MESRPSTDSRDEAVRAALRDAAALAGIVADEYQATYAGPERATYVSVLGKWVIDLGGRVEGAPTGLRATFPTRQIAIRFGPLSGHR